MPPETTRSQSPLNLPQSLSAWLSDALDAYTDYITLNRNLSGHSVRAYTRDVRQFADWLNAQEPELSITSGEASHAADAVPEPSEGQSLLSILPSAEWMKSLPGRYVAYLSRQSLGRPSISRKISALQSFFKFLQKDYLDHRSPEAALFRGLVFQSPKLARRLPDFLSPDEVNQLLAVLGTSDDSWLLARDKAIIELLFCSGMRVGELVALDGADVDWQQGELRVMGKGGRERVCFMNQTARDALERYLAQAKEHLDPPPGASDAPLFANAKGSRLTARSVHRMVEAAAKQASLGKEVHPHMFRHSFATHLLNHGVDLRLVQEMLGHVSISSTQIYTHITTERLRQAYLGAHPRARQ